MSKRRYFSALLFAGTGIWLLYIFAGCADNDRSVQPELPPSVLQQLGSVPPWATCTISLRNVLGAGEESLAQAQQLLQQIQKQTGWTDLHILQSEQASIVCRGYFKSFADDKAQQMLDEVRSYTDRQGRRPFQQAFFAALPREEQKKQIAFGPPEWDLRRAQGNASLCIGLFINDELCKDRLAAAVNKVKKLRDQGVEAWYYHGEYRSGVYVGHFNTDWELVTTGKTRDGEPIRRMEFVTHDPQFDILRKKFPNYEYNGQVQTYSIGKGQAFDASVLARIPRFGQEVSDTEAGLH